MFRPTLFAAALLASAPLFAQAETAPAPEPMTRAKLTANVDAEFKKMDTNKDGQLVKDEIEAAQLDAIKGRIAARNKALFAALDKDKNGSISVAEFDGLPAQAPRPDATSILRHDSGKDGKVNIAELKAASFANFDRMDTNKDGSVTLAEIRADAEKKAAAGR